MPMHQCMRNLDGLLAGEFNRGLQEPRSFSAEVLASRAQPLHGEWGSRRPRPGDASGLSWAQLLPSWCGEPCFSRRRSLPPHQPVSPPAVWAVGSEGRAGGGGRRDPPPSEVCLFTSLHPWGKSGEGLGRGVRGRIRVEQHLPFQRSHSP